MSIRFAIDHWAAWAPDLVVPEAWQAWLSAPYPIAGDGLPTLAEMPAMMRRRVERLGRMGLQAAYWGLQDSKCPIVFASRHGDVSRSIALLRQLANGEALSPTAFSMSVHNAMGALFSIARNDTTCYTAISAGVETIEAAFCEAMALLVDGEDAVLVVYYEEPLVEPFAGFGEAGEFPHAWSCRLSRAASGGYSLASVVSNESGGMPAELPPDLMALRFLLSGTSSYTHVAGPRTWQWRRHA